MHKNVVPLSLSAAGIAALVGSIVIAAGAPAVAARPAVRAAEADDRLVSIVRASDQSKIQGNNLDTIHVTAPRACNALATRHVLKIISITPTEAAQQANADKWANVNIYSPIGAHLPGPLSEPGGDSFQQMSEQRVQAPIVPGTWHFELRCQNNLGSTIYDRFTGTVTFSSPTAWTGYAEGVEPPKPPSSTGTGTGTGTPSPTGSTSATTGTTGTTTPVETTDVETTDVETTPAETTTTMSTTSTTSTSGDGQLADTGASAVLLGTVGLGLLGAGGTLLVIRRRQDAEAA